MKIHYRPTIILSFFVILLMASCIYTPELEPLDNYILYASTDGSFKGWWAFDENTLEKVDSIEMDRGVINFDISDDKSTFYSMDRYDIIATDINTKTIKIRTTTKNWGMTLDRNKEFIITHYPSEYLQFYDAETFELVYEDSLGEAITDAYAVAVSPTEDKIYASYHSEQDETCIMVYNTNTYQIERLINLNNKKIALMDLEVSPDGNYLFVVNNSDALFYVVDLSTDKIIHTHTCNYSAKIEVSPDGNYVYLSNPNSPIGELTKNQVLRYNVSSNKTRVFIHGPGDIGLESNYLYIDKIIIAPDNRTMFITLGLSIARIDIKTKEIINRYKIPADYQGHITSSIKNILLVK